MHSWDLLQLFSALLISVSIAVGMSLRDSVPIIMEPTCKVTCFLLQHGSSRFAEINDCSLVGLRKKRRKVIREQQVTVSFIVCFCLLGTQTGWKDDVICNN